MLSHHFYPYPDIGLIAQTLNLRKTNTGFIGSCPVCSYPGSLSVKENQGRLLTYCHAGCDSNSVFNAVLKTKQSPTPTREFSLARSTNQYAEKLWQQSSSAKGSLAEIYLQHRGYRGPIPESLRYLSDHQHKPSGQRYPVMLAKVTDQHGCFLSVHRTYLSLNGKGKAPVEPAKMTLGSIRGGAIRLSEAKDQLILCEGIETGLALLHASQIPVWSCISAGGLKTVNLPTYIQTVIIAADYDKPGLQAAEEGAARFYKQGLTVKVIKPKLLGTDFADELLMS